METVYAIRKRDRQYRQEPGGRVDMVEEVPRC